MDDLRHACATVAERARAVGVVADAISPYAGSLAISAPPPEQQPRRHDREQLAAFWLTLDAINFGSGWFPTLAQTRPAIGLSNDRGWPARPVRARAAMEPRTTDADRRSDDRRRSGSAPRPRADGTVRAICSTTSANTSLPNMEARSAASSTRQAARRSRLAQALGRWACFADSSRYDELEVPFLQARTDRRRRPRSAPGSPNSAI